MLHANGTANLLIAVSLSIFAHPAFAKVAPVYERIDEIADFKQNNPLAGFADGGEEFCAPTSLSDHLMWLGNHG